MSHPALVKIAESLVHAYSEKNWNELWSLVDPRIVYDETATNRKTYGVRNFITTLREWGTAFPDSKITIKSTKSYGNTVAFDLQWTGTHEGIIETPGGEILPTGKKIDLHASMVIEVGEREVGLSVGGNREFVESEVGPPLVGSVIHYFSMAVMEKQLELTAEEKVA